MGNVGKDGNHVSINGHENRAGVLHLQFSTGVPNCWIPRVCIVLLETKIEDHPKQDSIR